MGWLFTSSLGGHAGPKQYLDAQFTYERPGRSSKVLRSALTRMRTYYAAVELLAEAKPREVCGLVCLVKYKPKLLHGQLVTFAEPIRFADGRSHQTLRVDINPRLNRRVRFRSLDGCGYYRIGGLKSLTYTVGPSAASDPPPSRQGELI